MGGTGVKKLAARVGEVGAQPRGFAAQVIDIGQSRDFVAGAGERLGDFGAFGGDARGAFIQGRQFCAHTGQAGRDLGLPRACRVARGFARPQMVAGGPFGLFGRRQGGAGALSRRGHLGQFAVRRGRRRLHRDQPVALLQTDRLAAALGGRSHQTIPAPQPPSRVTKR